jgi:predicted nucleotide-binding protein
LTWPMIKEINLKRIEEIRNQLIKVSPTDPFFVQNMHNCDSDAAILARELFGKNSEYRKALDASTKLSPDNRKDMILKVLDSMSEALSARPTKETSFATGSLGIHPDVHHPSEEKDCVFIVHGRNNSAKDKVYQFLIELNLYPIILHDQPNKGRTIIEKFEDHSSDAKYAVILLTPDDQGGLISEPITLSPRARQNVVFEMGYFFGRLGRGKVCALVDPNIERPSDIDGIMYISLDQSEAWKGSLFRELKAAKLKLEDWIDPQIDSLAEGLYKDSIALSFGQIELKSWTELDESDKKPYRQQATKLLDEMGIK